MDNFIFSLNATVPVFLVMVLGWVLMKTGMLTRSFTTVADRFVFKAALPVLLFQDIATADIRQVFDPAFIAFCMISTTLMFVGVWLFARWYLRKQPEMIGAFAQGAARGSAAVLGIAFIENIYGNSGMAPLMIISAVPLYNIFSVVILTIGEDMGKISSKNTLPSKGASSMKATLKKACINIAKNPIILGILAGCLYNLSGLPIPQMLLKTVDSVSSLATPLALLVVGASFDMGHALEKFRPALVASFIKLLVLPAIFFPFAIAFGFRESELVAILIMLGSPTTVSCYIMAKNMHNDAVLTSGIIVLATLLSSVTLTFWIFLLRSLALI